MAMVSNIERSEKSRQSVHSRTRCLYSIVDTTDGNRVLQLDTLGADDRQFPDKVSQSIQFDRNAAKQLLALIEQTFPGLTSEDSEEGVVDEDEESFSSSEGNVAFRIHRRIERDSSIVRRKKQSVLESTGKLACEVCGFDFAVEYGERGVGFAECHHRTPLGELREETTTSLCDLAIVCANCHRMLHHGTAISVEELSTLIESNRRAASSTP